VDSFSIETVYMKLNWSDQLGLESPAVAENSKDGLNPRNLLAGLISLLGQLLVSVSSELICRVPKLRKRVTNPLVLALATPDTCFSGQPGQFVINWQMWWLDLFTWLSLIGIFALLAGTTC